jgi:hypothetical protein
MHLEHLSCSYTLLSFTHSDNEDLIDEASQDQETREPQTSAEAKGTR